MKFMQFLMPGIASALLFMACGSADSASATTPEKNTTTMTEQTADTASVRVAVKTTAGDFTVLLYGDTPKHRDNFVRLVKDGYYDGTLFHRVIKDFMIQAGDPDSKNAAPGKMLGAGGPDYKIDAEIVFPRHFHKRGALAAARQGDQVNPMKQSSGSQFYVVTGRKMSESDVDKLGMSLKNKQMQAIFNRLAMEHRADIIDMQKRGDRAGLQALQDSLIKQTEAEAATAAAPAITDEMRKAYTTVGGAPHLDGDYTVFGEVVDGMDVIDRIEKVKTDGHDRPTDDVRIISMKILD
ncbi:MAG: peptidylprolyl isomerase [Muribaculaceae bacterium]|nr:peptidylprolyl isomerase [Muribaculaceae bacterium]